MLSSELTRQTIDTYFQTHFSSQSIGICFTVFSILSWTVSLQMKIKYMVWLNHCNNLEILTLGYPECTNRNKTGLSNNLKGSMFFLFVCLFSCEQSKKVELFTVVAHCNTLVMRFCKGTINSLMSQIRDNKNMNAAVLQIFFLYDLCFAKLLLVSSVCKNSYAEIICLNYLYH